MPTQGGEQLGRRELQAQSEQQRDDADLRGALHKRCGGAQRDHSTLAEGEGGHQDERNGGQAEPSGQQSQQRKAEEQQAQLEEEH